MSISRRITLYSTGLLFLLLLVVNGSIYLSFNHLTANSELERVSNQAKSIASSIKHDRTVTARASELLSGYVPTNGIIRVIRDTGKEAVIITKDPDLRALPSTFSLSQHSEIIHHNNNPYAVASIPVIWEDGTVVALEYSEKMVAYESTMNTLKVVLVVASIIVLVPAFLAGRSLSTIIIKPIQTLQNTMERIRKEGTFQRLNVSEKPKDELEQMGETFNKMIEILESNYEKQRRFISDASHELRTPLTVIESYSKLLKRWGKHDPNRLEEAINAIHDESIRMKNLTKQLLLLATNEQEKATTLSEKINITAITTETAKKLSVAFDRDVSVTTHTEYFVLGNDLQLKQVLFILIENGLKYSKAPIQINIEKDKDYIKLLFIDKGIGIPAEDLPHIFNRFFRVDKTRSRQTGGSGLGLSIAKSIIDAHNGKIEVASTVNEGTTFTLFLKECKDIREEIK
ncbi:MULTISPECIES: HAMP domain-containing sensor histidine kinase [Sutcliffiella]|uniref:histidine kinase n=1 Tax=Sutcliffiella cohnii TaxID=33932 RepID=A0A223KQX0_9BACI|nr:MULTISPECIES: ATP-binding protein [Sutcliffiella]AST91872.1 hypothetical protein BC6307_11575 [Sutcliffiella cohnii]WBL13099.1 ATP-binding protein [Sutcliffiella sp. NC1]